MPRGRSSQRDVQVKLGVHRLVRCGYYTFRGAAPLIDTTSEVWPEVTAWVRARGRLVATRTEFRGVDPDAVQELGDEPLLCRGIAESGDDFLFAMYQVIGEGKNAVSSLSPDARVDEDDPEPFDPGGGRLTGLSRYIWVLPDARAVCTIRLSSPGTGLRQFVRWLRDYLHFWSGQVLRSYGGEADVACYPRVGSGAEEAEEPPRVYGRAACVEAADLRAMRRALITNRSIRAVWFRGRLRPSQARSELRGVFGSLASLVPSAPFQGRQIEAKVTMREPTPAGLDRSLVAELQNRWRDDPSEIDLGFEFDGNQVVWMSRPRPLKQDVRLPFRGLSDEQVDLGALLQTLQNRFRAEVVRTAEAAIAEAEEGEEEDSDG